MLHCLRKAMLYNVDMSMGRRIAAARKSRGLTQQALAQKLKVSKNAVSEWERDNGQPEAQRLPALRRALDVPFDWLLDGVGKPPPRDELLLLMEGLPAEARRQAINLLRALATPAEDVA